MATARPVRQPTSSTPSTTSVTITNALSGTYPRATDRAAIPACVQLRLLMPEILSEIIMQSKRP